MSFGIKIQETNVKVIKPSWEEMSPKGVRSQAVSEVDPLNYPKDLYRTVQITNRAEKGALKGKPARLCYGSKYYPEESTDDVATWLQPGDSILVERELILGLFGLIFHNRLSPDAKESIIIRFGDWQWEGAPDGGYSQNSIPSMRKTGPPRALPDLIVQQFNNKNQAVGEAISIYELLIGDTEFAKARAGTVPVKDKQ